VDIGVHQDGLVHVSALANRFVSDPREVVKSGQVVRVKVLEADPERKRISLTLRLDDEPAASGGSAPSSRGRSGDRPGAPTTAAPRQAGRQPQPQRSAPQPRTTPQPRTPPQPRNSPAPANTAMAEALRQAGLGK
jgi:uncharacterized protein